MAEGTVVSRYNSDYLQRVAVGGIAGIGIIVRFVWMLVANHLPLSAYPAFIALIAFVIGAIWIVFPPANTRRLVIAPENITIWLIIGKPMLIKHTDIKSITTFSDYDNGNKSGKLLKSVDLQLELNNGKVIRFRESQFDNYNEIKRALWDYRLEAFEKLRNTSPTE